MNLVLARARTGGQRASWFARPQSTEGWLQAFRRVIGALPSSAGAHHTHTRTKHATGTPCNRVAFGRVAAPQIAVVRYRHRHRPCGRDMNASGDRKSRLAVDYLPHSAPSRGRCDLPSVAVRCSRNAVDGMCPRGSFRVRFFISAESLKLLSSPGLDSLHTD